MIRLDLRELSSKIRQRGLVGKDEQAIDRLDGSTVAGPAISNFGGS